MPSTPSPVRTLSSRRWLAPGLIAAAQLMVIMDTSIIGVALPEMHELGFTPESLSWVFKAHGVALLLGSRLSDLFKGSPGRGIPGRQKLAWPGTKRRMEAVPQAVRQGGLP